LLPQLPDGRLTPRHGDVSLKRVGVALCALVALAGSCTGERPASGPPRVATPTSSPHPSALPSVSPVVAEAVVLTANLSETPAKWQRVFFVPFGKRSSELGFKSFHESLNSQPSSFSVDVDGSVWIADRWKERVVHYSSAGKYVESVAVARSPSTSIGGTRGRIRDIIVTRDHLWALFEPSGGPLARIASDGAVEFLRPRLQSRDLWVGEIFPSDGPLTMLVGGFVNPERGFVEDGPSGFFKWDPPGVPEQLQGLPDGKGSQIQLERASGASSSVGDQDFELRFLAPDQGFVQPFHVDLTTGVGTSARSLPAEVGPGNLLPTADDVVMYVMLAPSRAGDARRYGGGRWLLRLGRSPVLWERLPDPSIPDEPQHRHLALGPGGIIYLMVARKGGMLILRRP
jgi:hypothetical protein